MKSNTKYFLIYSITSLVILNLSILIINLFSLTFFELNSKTDMRDKIFSITSSTSNEVDVLLHNKNLNDTIIQEKFEYIYEIASVGKFETFEIFLMI